MRVMITGRHMEVTSALRRYVEMRMKRLARYGMKLDGAQVVLSMEKYRHTAEIVLTLDGAVIQGKTSTSEMYASIDQLMDKISRRLLKRKEKLVNHKVRAPISQPSHEVSESGRGVVAYEIRRPPLYSLTVAQAAERLGVQSSSLLVFKEPSTNRIQVMRRLESGGIKLIDPQAI